MPGAGLAVPAVDDAMPEVPGVDDAMPDVPKARPQVLPTARATGAPSPAIPSAYCYCVVWRPLWFLSDHVRHTRRHMWPSWSSSAPGTCPGPWALRRPSQERLAPKSAQVVSALARATSKNWRTHTRAHNHTPTHHTSTHPLTQRPAPHAHHTHTHHTHTHTHTHTHELC